MSSLMAGKKPKQADAAKQKFSLKGLSLQDIFPYILISTAIVGFAASFVLMLEHIALLKDPLHQLSCSFNPVLSCGPIMQSDTATVFGFPNPLMGLASFAAQGLLGLAILAGAKMRSWFWKLYSLTVLGSIGFTLFLMYESLFVIKAICIYCLAVWIVLILSSWYTFQYMLAEKHLSSFTRTGVGMWIRRHHGDILLMIYLVLTGLILHEFWYFYGPKLGF
jgi:uncharacterized membrane protein